MCAQALADGWEFVALFADVENLVSNAVFRRISFYPVCDSHQYIFSQPNHA